ncbi:3-deoxy-8-phosphooctulonate synthase [Candidatus Calescamantes bacterium]|nr:3-deoxy-8-phosphooctulonate synthase [Candidatus Calescamantes bacterium]
MRRMVKIGDINIGKGNHLLLIAGPCVIENEDLTLKIAEELKKITQRLKLPFIFKASYDKANRTSLHSFRGPGLKEGLKILKKVKEKIGSLVLTDVHCVTQVKPVAEVVDVLQIPAFLSRQTDLLVEAGKTGKPVNIKKGQFMSPFNMKHAVEKVASTGNRKILLTERGTFFGYGELVVDMKNLPIMRSLCYPVIFDVTHSVQMPGGKGTVSGGRREFIPYLSRAAVACGVDGLFMETHPNPENALSDGPNMWPLQKIEELLKTLIEIHEVVRCID